eukprot:TRINITY_DN6840_c1_g2_i1.p1 TRINITY_DN6840_c1_g2~~TRINITY_DN6840_c1_g2_i1.p1  ORF type:complete len:347 (-),score=89.32 TRINITY_DN6840_c1_g2_i1:1120-2160(-)
MEEESDPLKVLIIGSCGVGKSSLLRTLVLNQPLNANSSESLSPTVGLDFKPYSFMVDKDKVNSRIWDIGGDPKYQKLAHPHFPWTHVFFIVFALNDPKSLDIAQSYASSIQGTAHAQACRALIGNKKDSKDTFISKSDGEDIARFLNCDFYFEVSACDTKSVTMAMEKVIHRAFCIFRKKNGSKVPSSLLSVEKKTKEYFGLPASERIVGEFRCMRKFAHGVLIVMTSCVCFLPFVLPKKSFAFCIWYKDIKKIQLRQLVLLFATGLTFVVEDHECGVHALFSRKDVLWLICEQMRLLGLDCKDIIESDESKDSKGSKDSKDSKHGSGPSSDEQQQIQVGKEERKN